MNSIGGFGSPGPATEVVVTSVPPGVDVDVEDDVEDEPGAVVEVEVDVEDEPGAVVEVEDDVEDVLVVVVDESDGDDVVVVGSGQIPADQLIVVVVVKNGLVVELAATVVVEPVASAITSPTHNTTWEIALSPSVPPPCPPGSETPFLFTSAKTPVPAVGE